MESNVKHLGVILVCTRVDCGTTEEKIRKQIVIPKIGEIVPLTETSAYISIRRVAESGNGITQEPWPPANWTDRTEYNSTFHFYKDTLAVFVGNNDLVVKKLVECTLQ